MGEVSEREVRRLELEIGELQEELRATRFEMDRRDGHFQEFVYAVSHDLRAPLRHLSEFTTLFCADNASSVDEESLETLSHMQTSVARLQGMLMALLEYSRVESQGKVFEKVDLGSVLSFVRDSIAERIEAEEATLQIDALPAVNGDHQQLQRLFTALIDNALNYCRNKSEIHVSASQEPGQWVVRVVDNGIGIEPRQVDRIFTLFQRLKVMPDVPGLGAGLSVCQRIADRHGGRIWCESDGENGSQFCLSIPVLQG
jgi:light-regulated signal transduction histidine kinase (bacteriophytochrome)